LPEKNAHGQRADGGNQAGAIVANQHYQPLVRRTDLETRGAEREKIITFPNSSVYIPLRGMMNERFRDP